MSFDKLADDVAKMGADQATAFASAAAAEGAGGQAAAGGEGATGATQPETPLVKSFEFTLEDGTKVVAVDGAEMVKSLQQEFETQNASLTKALTGIVGMLKAQGEAIVALGKSGAGRRSVVSMPAATGTAATNAAPTGGAGQKPTGAELESLMAKAMKLNEEGKLGSKEVAYVEHCCNLGMRPPEEMMKALRD